MQGLHLTGDLLDCDCSAELLIALDPLATLCRDATVAAGLTIVDEKYHVFPEWQGQPGGITGTVLLAESHLAVHTWPERRGVTLDVYVCNFTADNSAKAEQLFEALMMAFRPGRRIVNRIQRGDLTAAHATDAPASDSTGSGGAERLVFDWLNPHAGYGFNVTRTLVAKDTRYQRLELFDTPQFGRMLRLDGRFMTAEGEEFVYHECMTHPALLAHPAPRRVLILGGGDGGTAEEVLKHPSVEAITIAELDRDVVTESRAHLASIHRGSLDHPKVRIEITDGFAFVEGSTEQYDLIVLDLTDPDTPAFRLYSPEFLALCKARLAPGGFLTMHIGSPVYQADTVKRNVAALRGVFREVHPLAAFMPLYGSLWCLAIASNDISPLIDAATREERFAERALADLRYYYPALTPALFTPPRYVRDLVEPASPTAATHRVTSLRAAA